MTLKKNNSILFVARNFYPSTLGGPSNTLYWLASELVKKNFKVTVITTDDYIIKAQVTRNQKCDVEGIQVIYVHVRTNDNNHLELHGYIRYYINAIDIVVLSSIFYKPSFLAAMWATLKGKKIIWSPRGELFEAALLNKSGKYMYIRLLRLLYGSRTIFHATSEVEQIQIEKYFGKKVSTFVLPNYMRLPNKQKRTAKEQYLLFVGRIAPIKALDKLLEALAISKKFRESDYTFCIAGGVEAQFEAYYQSLLRLISKLQLGDKVKFLGSVTGKEKEQLYADAYMSFLVSNSENFGNVVIEALAQGTPVVASKGTPWSSLNERQAGFWISNDSQNLAVCIDEILTMQPETYQSMRQNALKLAGDFDVERNISKWIQVLES